MKSNYKPIGEFIRQVDERNKGLRVQQLLGLSISKRFIPSVANTIGADMENYKIIRKSQFACSTMQVRRDKKMPVALLHELDEAIISQAYPVFEVKDENILLPEYLMMWFERAEFDREACFHAVGGVRGSLEWEDFEEMRLPVPPIAKQRELVQEYQAIENRMALNQQLIQKLEETAQAIYREWFVEFEFPDESGKPYRSSGGEMVWNDGLGKEIPKGWEVQPFTKAVKLGGGGTPDTNNSEYWNGEIPFYTPSDLTVHYYTTFTQKTISSLGLTKCSSKLYPVNTTFVTARGATVGGVALSGRPMAMNQTCYAINGNGANDLYIHQLTRLVMSYLKKEAVGATFEALVTKDFDYVNVVVPNLGIDIQFSSRVNCIYELILLKTKENEMLNEIKSLLLSQIAIKK